MWLRRDVCRRYARPNLAGLHDVDYRTKTFSGSEAYFCLIEPNKEFGASARSRNPSAMRQLPSGSLISTDGGELPGAQRLMEGARPANRWISRIQGHRWLVRPTIELDGCCTSRSTSACASLRPSIDLGVRT